MRTPTAEENDTYNSLLSDIEEADSEDQKWDEVRAALKMLWALAGGEITETRGEKETRERQERWAAERAHVERHAKALSAILGTLDNPAFGRLQVGGTMTRTSVHLVQERTGILIADWNLTTGATSMGGKRGPACHTCESVVAWLQSV